MVINGDSLLMASPISDMISEKRREFGVSHGLAEVGYDIRIKQEVLFVPGEIVKIAAIDPVDIVPMALPDEVYLFEERPEELQTQASFGSFVLASTIEHFRMPIDLVGIVHDKSTWARQGLSVFNTVIEPGWSGFLTLELAFRGRDPIHIPAGAGIAQVVFHHLDQFAAYSGKYQNQEDRPVSSIFH